MTPELMTAVTVVTTTISALLTGAFGWMAKQISDLKREVKASNAMHTECERARSADAVKLLRFEWELGQLRHTVGLTPMVPPPDADHVPSEEAKETVVLSDEEKEKLRREAR